LLKVAGGGGVEEKEAVGHIDMAHHCAQIVLDKIKCLTIFYLIEKYATLPPPPFFYL